MYRLSDCYDGTSAVLGYFFTEEEAREAEMEYLASRIARGLDFNTSVTLVTDEEIRRENEEREAAREKFMEVWKRCMYTLSE